MTNQTAVGEAAVQETDPELQIHAAVVMLRVGGIVCFPTDTLFALGADAFNAEAVERVYRAKDRDHAQGLPVLLSDVEQLNSVAIDVPESALTLAQQYWPGALTLVVRRSPDLPEVVSGGAMTVAVRVPDHPVARQIIRELGRPVIGTSANRSGASDARSLENVVEELGPWLDYTVGEGTLPAGEPSTIVDLTTARPEVLREGAIPSAEILAVLADADSKGGRARGRRTRVR